MAVIILNILYKVTAKLEICYNNYLCSSLAYILEERTAVYMFFSYLAFLLATSMYTRDCTNIFKKIVSRFVVDSLSVSPSVFALLSAPSHKIARKLLIDSLLSPRVSLLC